MKVIIKTREGDTRFPVAMHLESDVGAPVVLVFTKREAVQIGVHLQSAVIAKYYEGTYEAELEV